MITTVIVCILAGLGAGLGTGFAGMSAAAVISPSLTSSSGAISSGVPAKADRALSILKRCAGRTAGAFAF